MPDATPDTKQYQCRHIFTDGHRCASPCLRQQEFCYYHHTTRKPVADPRQRRSRRSTFHLPLPEDRSAIQSSIGQVLQRIASNDIDPRRAGLLLYGLQIASLNLPKPQPNTQPATRSGYPTRSPYEPETENQTVEEITIDPALGILAPRTEIGKPEEHKSSVRKLIEKLIQRDEEEKAARLEPVSIPTIQATIQTTQETCRQPFETPSNPCRFGAPAVSRLEFAADAPRKRLRETTTARRKGCNRGIPVTGALENTHPFASRIGCGRPSHRWLRKPGVLPQGPPASD